MSNDGPQYPEYPGANDPDRGPDHGQQPPPPPPPPAGQPEPAPAWGQQVPPPAPAQGDNQKAMWAMILGIISLVCCGLLTGIPAIILSTQAKREIALSGGLQSGAGMATAGLVLGIIGTAFSVLFLLFLMVGLATGA